MPANENAFINSLNAKVFMQNVAEYTLFVQDYPYRQRTVTGLNKHVVDGLLPIFSDNFYVHSHCQFVIYDQNNVIFASNNPTRWPVGATVKNNERDWPERAK